MNLKLAAIIKDGFSIERNVRSFSRTTITSGAIKHDDISIRYSLKSKLSEENVVENEVEFSSASKVSSDKTHLVTSMMITLANYIQEVINEIELLKQPKAAFEKILNAMAQDNLDDAFTLWGNCISMSLDCDGKALAVRLIQSEQYKLLLTRCKAEVSQRTPVVNFIYDSFNKVSASTLDEIGAVRFPDFVEDAIKLDVSKISEFRREVDNLADSDKYLI